MKSRRLRFGSVCSGVEAASVAFGGKASGLDWECVFLSEIEPFPCAVLHDRFGASKPKYVLDAEAGDESKSWGRIIEREFENRGRNDVVNFGDFTKISSEDLKDVGAIDVLVGGTPCQGFSLAGLRKGLDDDRSGLAREFLELAKRARPRWIVWENVPGVMSSWSGEPEDETVEEWEETNDFDQFLAGLQECGYGVAYRVLDVQYVRVEQGFPGAIPQRRRRVFVVGCLGDWRGAAAVLSEPEGLRGDSPPSRRKGQGVAGYAQGGFGNYREDGAAGTCRASGGDLGGRSESLVANTLQTTCGDYSRSDGFNMVVCYENHGNDSRIKEAGDLCPTLTSRGGTGGGNLPIVLSNEERIVKSEELYCFGWNKSKDQTMRVDNETSETLQASPCSNPAVAIAGNIIGRDKGNGGNGLGAQEGVSYTLTGMDKHAVAFMAAVRRLMPIECERLMGFPDNHTQIAWNGKSSEDCPDGYRYKACGNSIGVNVLRWLGHRIQQVELLLIRG